MSDTGQTSSTHPPSNPSKTVDKDGYRASFYPGFIGRLAVRSPEKEVELYQQEEVFYLPPGYTKPWPTSTLEFSGPDGRRFVLQIDDPHQQIGRIEVHLKDPDAPPLMRKLRPGVVGHSDPGYPDPEPPPPSSYGDPFGGGLIVIAEDGVVLCPPICPIIPT
jgi:hypothetical protein